MISVFDIGALAVHGDMYKAWVAPDAFPGQPQPRLSNWNEEDLTAYCGGQYMKENA